MRRIASSLCLLLAFLASCPDGGVPFRKDRGPLDVPSGDGAPGEVATGGPCAPCTADGDCATGECVEIDGGRFCSARCETATSCPAYWRCEAPGPSADLRCLPPSRSCSCLSGDEGATRPCKNGTSDSACEGTATCDPLAGWRCDASTPADETCNGLDDDCDGATDEDFMAEGLYLHDEHCGTCGASCLGLWDHGVGRCVATEGVPKCELATCLPGWVQEAGACVRMGGSICTPCAIDADCDGGRCVPVGGEGLFCTYSCASTPCPAGHDCRPVSSGQVCVPSGGSCVCTPDSLGLTRTCHHTSPAGTCTGLEKCTAAGFAGCTAAFPEAETCNGLDDDCDGEIDQGLVAYACENSKPGLGACEGITHCAGADGWICDAPEPTLETCDYLDNDCDDEIDDGFRDPLTGRYTGDENCGSCGNDCTLLEFDNGVGRCKSTAVEDRCVLACVAGFVDVNHIEEDGCECKYLGEDDPPDGIDQDCNGIDGEPDLAVFVAPSGSDQNPGTITAPLRSLQKGIDAAGIKGLPYVYVAGGAYTGPIVLDAGIEVWGGFDPAFAKRNPAANTSLVSSPACPSGSAPGTVNAIGITGGDRTLFSGFTIEGPACPGPGASSYAVYVRGCDATLEFAEDVVLAGSGGAGTDGADGKDGPAGSAGGDGTAAKDAGMSPCIPPLAPPGGAGGAGLCGGTDTSGGAGGAPVCPDFDATLGPDDCFGSSNPYQTSTPTEQGRDGKPAGLGGAGGTPGKDGLITPIFSDSTTGECSEPAWACQSCWLADYQTEGQAGAGGGPGKAGAGGSGCADAQGGVADGRWVGKTGGSGGGGSAGGGGGGGGAGGGVETSEECAYASGWGGLDFSDFGGSGGGGGSGGCAGTAGTGGSAGGGAFGFFLAWDAPPASLPVIEACIVRTGTGGPGGRGGAGGAGGVGGHGGRGGEAGSSPETWCAKAGRDGGNGGSGGAGGGGGGGCGGPSFGLFVQKVGIASPAAYAGTAVAYQLTGSGGTGGKGGKLGTSASNPGGNGATGTHAATNP